VGIGLRPQVQESHQQPGHNSADDAAARAAIEAGTARNSGSSAAPEGAAGRLDARGRPLPQKEQIEIPSFLRKHG
jgi:cell division protein FtsZ